MLVKIIIKPDGSREHEVVERSAGEQCSRVFELNVGDIVSEETIGPECDDKGQELNL